MQIVLTALLFLPSAISLPASPPTNTTATAPCVSHVPQIGVEADLTITVWNQTNCKGSAGVSYPFVYELNLYQDTYFKSYTLSRMYHPHQLLRFHMSLGHLRVSVFPHQRHNADSNSFRCPPF